MEVLRSFRTGGVLVGVLLIHAGACGSSPDGGGQTTGPDGGTVADAPLADAPLADAPLADAPVQAGSNDAGLADAPPAPSGDIGTWTDSAGACPAGFTRIDVTTLADLQDATRGEGSHANDPPDACYLIHDAVYKQQGSTLVFYVRAGGASASRPRIFVGQSRAGTVIRGKGTLDDGVSHVVIENLTFDITGYAQTGSFSTLELPVVDDVRVSHVTLTGDCATGANGGHIELIGATNAVIDSCLIEKFGRCGTADGHQDHGIYLDTASNVTIRNCDIRGNASRGIQLYTAKGEYGTIDGVTIAGNRIHDNGHADYEDGIVLNGGGTGTITNVTVEHNLIYANYYSGIRTVDRAYTNVIVRKNTFYRNGAASSGSGPAEIVLDGNGSGQSETFSSNILSAAAKVTNGCYDATSRSYKITDNVVQGTLPSGATCVTDSVVLDPQFRDPAAADFHTSNAGAATYGAYAP